MPHRPLSRRRRAQGAVLLTLSVLSACEGVPLAPNVREHAERPAAARLAGEDIFRAVTFADGPGADSIPFVKANLRATDHAPAAQVAQLRAMERRFLGYVRAADPAFFPRFERAMRSGDPVVVSGALADARRVTWAALQQSPEISQLRAQAKADPARFRVALAQMRETARRVQARQGGAPGVAARVASEHPAGAAGAASAADDSAAVDRAIDATFAAVLDGGAMPNGDAGACLAEFLVVWIYAVFAQDLAVILNVVAGVFIVAPGPVYVAQWFWGPQNPGCQTDPDINLIQEPDCQREYFGYSELVASATTALART